MKEYTKEEVKNLLLTNDKWLYRALIRLYELQTTEEQNSEQTLKQNGQGFNSSDARLLSYLAKWVMKNNSLNEYWKEKARIKIVKYAGQIIKLIEEGRNK